MTRVLLWQEQKARAPTAASTARSAATTRPSDDGGLDRHSRAVRAAQIFVAALGTNYYTCFEATLTQAVADWLGAYVRTLKHLGRT